MGRSGGGGGVELSGRMALTCLALWSVSEHIVHIACSLGLRDLDQLTSDSESTFQARVREFVTENRTELE